MTQQDVTSPPVRPCPQPAKQAKVTSVAGEKLHDNEDASDIQSANADSPPPSGLQSEGQIVWTPAPKVDTAAPEYPKVLTEGELKWPGEWHLIALMVAQGYSQRYIAGHLNYTEGRISTIVNKPEVQERIERIRKEDSSNLTRRYSQIAPRALDYFERVVDGKEAANVGQRMTAAQWILEKKDGKPKQEVALDGGATIMELLRALDVEKAARAEASRAVTESQDIEMKPAPPPDPLAAWVEQNVPGGTNEEGK